jgi:E3 ubiquitin-protein ligase HUWE1
VCNAIGAICLNQAGIDFVKSHPLVFISLVKTATSPKVEDVMGERDAAQHLGSSFDELVRHHPQLQEIVLGAVKDIVQECLAVAAIDQKEEDGLPKLNKIFKVSTSLCSTDE